MAVERAEQLLRELRDGLSSDDQDYNFLSGLLRSTKEYNRLRAEGLPTSLASQINLAFGQHLPDEAPTNETLEPLVFGKGRNQYIEDNHPALHAVFTGIKPGQKAPFGRHLMAIIDVNRRHRWYPEKDLLELPTIGSIRDVDPRLLYINSSLGERGVGFIKEAFRRPSESSE